MIVEDIAKYLAQQGLGEFGTDIFGMAFPKDTDEGVCIYDGISGISDTYCIVDNPAIQIISRSSNSITANDKAIQAYKLLHGTIRSKQIGNTFIYQCFATGYPESIGRDANGLWMWSMNMNLQIKY
ncbi:minor capsid protein [Clostridium pasteurianum]|uniref:Uncharacterized protein n=1 Tax=Clostridium pasteurianum BC1 TaxID=86416 RepID=R4KCR4_CLOPA|nr:minor capsid protein [Clostridium pasteurianum]AGK97410.1 hypothetical protein Clopa_2550 [Clostridium pasteurianum BC1]